MDDTYHEIPPQTSVFKLGQWLWQSTCSRYHLKSLFMSSFSIFRSAVMWPLVMRKASVHIVHNINSIKYNNNYYHWRLIWFTTERVTLFHDSTVSMTSDTSGWSLIRLRCNNRSEIWTSIIRRYTRSTRVFPQLLRFEAATQLLESFSWNSWKVSGALSTKPWRGKKRRELEELRTGGKEPLCAHNWMYF